MRPAGTLLRKNHANEAKQLGRFRRNARNGFARPFAPTNESPRVRSKCGTGHDRAGTAVDICSRATRTITRRMRHGAATQTPFTEKKNTPPRHRRGRSLIQGAPKREQHCARRVDGISKHTARGVSGKHGPSSRLRRGADLATHKGRRCSFDESQQTGVDDCLSPPLRRRGREKILRALTIAQYCCTCAMHCTCRGNVPLYVQANRSAQGVTAMSG